MQLHVLLFPVKDWLSLVPLGAAIGGVGYMSYLAFCPKARCKSTKCGINPSIHKENAKHVDVLDIESIGDKAALCRCWRSQKVLASNLKFVIVYSYFTYVLIYIYCFFFSFLIVMVHIISLTIKLGTMLDQFWFRRKNPKSLVGI